MYIVGGLEDQVSLLVWPQVSAGFFSLLSSVASHSAYQVIFSPMLSPFTTSEPVLWTYLSVFLNIFGSSFYNLFILLTVVLNLAFSSLLFKKYKFGLVYAIIFAFSSYFWIHLGVHPALSQIWLIPLFIYLLFKFDMEGWSIKKALVLAFVLVASFLISNYIGFFLLIFLSLHTAFTRKNLRYYLFTLFSTVFVVAVILFPFVKLAYFTNPAESELTRGVTRPYEDFFHFSSRPWYFLLPPVKNPWLGDFSKNILERIGSTDYFLADDYFAAEHQGNYFGLLLIFSTSVAFVYSLSSGDKELKKAGIKLAAMVIIISLLMFPPFFTISGNTFWTPGQLMYKFFPMFRATSRLGVVLLLLSLLLVARSVDSMFERLENKRKLLRIFVVLLLVVTLFETYVPMKFEKIDDGPAVYEYMRDALEKEAKFMVYPFSRTEEALLWLGTHQKHLMNPRHFSMGGIPGDELTQALVTPLGIQSVRDLGVDYILVFKDTQETLENPYLLKIVYEDFETLLYEIL